MYNKCRAVLLRVGAEFVAFAFSPPGVQHENEGWAKGVDALSGLDSSLSEPTESKNGKDYYTYIYYIFKRELQIIATIVNSKKLTKTGDCHLIFIFKAKNYRTVKKKRIHTKKI